MLIPCSIFNKSELRGGFKLLTSAKCSRTKLDIMHTGSCSAEYLKLTCSSRFYVRPIQQDIPLDKDKLSSITLKDTL